MKFDRRREKKPTLGEKSQEREVIFKILILLCFSILLLRLFYLQVIRGNDYSYFNRY